MKNLADSLNVQPSSLYNHVKGLDDLQNELMLYGWRSIEEQMVKAAVGVRTGTLRRRCFLSVLR